MCDMLLNLNDRKLTDIWRWNKVKTKYSTCPFGNAKYLFEKPICGDRTT